MNKIRGRRSGNIHYAWKIFACCCAVNACVLGIVANTAGIYLQPVSAEMGWPLAKMNFYLTIIQIVMTVTLPIVGIVLPKINIKLSIGLSCFVMGATYALSAAFHSLTDWYIAGVILGICYAFLMYIPIPLLINNWFKKYVGTILGIVAAGASLVAAFTNPLGSLLITQHGWRVARIVLGLASILLSVPLVIAFLKYRPEDIGLRPYGTDENAVNNREGQAIRGMTARQAAKTFPFYFVFIFSGLLVMSASMLQQVPGYAVSVGLSPTVGATGVSCIMIGGIFGKIVLGGLTDRWGFAKAAIVGCLCGLLGVTTLLLSGNRLILFFIGTFLFGGAYAAIVVIPPMAVRGTFGTKEYSQIYSWITVANGAFGALTPIAVGIIFDRTHSYSLSWEICLAAYVIVVLLVVLTRVTSRKLRSRYEINL
ncbi:MULTISPECIES: MFS transporter [unclassified Sporolactobacillus]|uniref:MFS transporter n=1 Tax=unclassified Sporolactobacillus TaxID=2628533 RepID=UPI0023680B0A|nr:MFS transporter [Sporolactobacillus sp. CQH2019]MDD9146952.1 MFS transporter [Sporolactobacillus sp. CQH2019]